MASIETRRIGTGQMRFRVVWYEARTKQRITFATRDEAVRFRKLVEGSGNKWPQGWDRPQGARPPDSTVLTFDTWARKAVERRSRANERTKADYLRDLDRHFTYLAAMPLDAIRDEHVIGWLDNRRAAGLADKTVRNLHGFGSSVMADALSQHPPLVTHNPFANRLNERATVRTEEMVFLTPPEFDMLLRHVPDERGYRELVRLLYGTGLRFGEATALHVRDVELFGKRKTLTVTKAWKRTGAGWMIGEPKTMRSRRTIGLSPELVDMLIPLVASRRGDELLFPGAGGGQLPHTEVYKRAWAPAVARSNVCDRHRDQLDKRGGAKRLPVPCDCPGVLGKTPRIHSLRHSHVAALIGEGIALPAISRRLGHSSIQITIDRYGHLDPALDEQINAAVDRTLAASPTAAASLYPA